MYSMYLDGMLMPVTPEKVKLMVGGRSTLVTLISGGQASMPAAPELAEISFTLLLPQVEYPFARYEGAFQGAEVFLERFEEIKTEGRPFRFVLSRWMPAGRRLFDTNLLVTMEEYSITEDAGSGFDVQVQMLLRRYRPMVMKELEVSADLPGAPVILEENRAVDSAVGTGSGSASGGKPGSSKGKGSGIIAPSTGTKEAEAVAKKVADKAAGGGVTTSAIPGLSTLLGMTAGSTASGGKTRAMSRR